MPKFAVNLFNSIRTRLTLVVILLLLVLLGLLLQWFTIMQNEENRRIARRDLMTAGRSGGFPRFA